MKFLFSLASMATLCLPVFAQTQSAPAACVADQLEVLSWHPRIFRLPHFLSDQECDEIISLGKPQLEPSKIIDDEADNDQGVLFAGRTSMGMFFAKNSSDTVIRDVERRISKLTMIPEEHGEEVQLLHYEPGGEFVPHYDFFDPTTAAGRAYLRSGGQRLVTVILYLNTPEKGGETVFPEAGVRVVPEKGSALIFYDCTPSGELDEKTLHTGAPVLAGEKWIATKWLRTDAQGDYERKDDDEF